MANRDTFEKEVYTGKESIDEPSKLLSELPLLLEQRLPTRRSESNLSLPLLLLEDASSPDSRASAKNTEQVPAHAVSGRVSEQTAQALADSAALKLILRGLQKDISEDSKSADDKAAKEIIKRWEEAIKASKLENPALKELMEETGKQIATGKLSPEKLQKLLLGVKVQFDDDSPQDLITLKRFTAAIKELYAIDINIDFAGKGDTLTIKSITIGQSGGGHQFLASLKIDRDGKVSSTEVLSAGINGPLTKDITTENVMQKLRKQASAASGEPRK